MGVGGAWRALSCPYRLPGSQSAWPPEKMAESASRGHFQRALRAGVPLEFAQHPWSSWHDVSPPSCGSPARSWLTPSRDRSRCWRIPPPLGACWVPAGCLLGPLLGACWPGACFDACLALVGCLLGACWALAGPLLGACWVLAGCLLGACWVLAGCLLGACWVLVVPLN